MEGHKYIEFWYYSVAFEISILRLSDFGPISITDAGLCKGYKYNSYIGFIGLTRTQRRYF